MTALDRAQDNRFAMIHQDAANAAALAAREHDAKMGPEAQRGLDCGFAWVQITPGNHPFVRYLKGAGIGDKHWDKGWYVWGSRLHGISTQSISTHEAAAQAYAHSIRESLPVAYKRGANSERWNAL